MTELFVVSAEIKEQREDSYVFSLPAIKNLGCMEFRAPITFLMGENGIGKSTLLEAIAVACGFNAEGGSVNFNFFTRETHSPLYKAMKVVRGFRRPKDGYFLRAESFYNVLTNIEELDEVQAPAPLIVGGYGGESLHNMSHGESFLKLVQERFFGNGLYILDEPEAALSPEGQLKLMAAIYDLAKNKGSQFIISTHSPILTACPESEVYNITKKGAELTDYRATPHYMIVKRFLNDPESILRELISGI